MNRYSDQTKGSTKRSEEMEFLGMSRRKKTAEEELNDPIKIMEQTREARKMK